MDLLTFENLANLGVLIFLQAVLGFDNLLYISIESQRAPKASRASVRRWGILIALALRVVLLFLMIQLLANLAKPLFEIHFEECLHGSKGLPVLFQTDFIITPMCFCRAVGVSERSGQSVLTTAGEGYQCRLTAVRSSGITGE